MSGKSLTYRSLAGIDISGLEKDDLKDFFRKILEKGIHGISFSAYLEGQGPGTRLVEEQIRQRMQILSPFVKWIRSFSCIDGNELIPKVAHEYGLKTLVGAWLGPDEAMNEEEIEGLIKTAKSGHADILAVGNEVILRGDLTENNILSYIHRVKKAVPHLPVGYVDAYFQFVSYPRITAACDVILVNCYPFWEGYSIEHAFVYLKQMYYLAKKVSMGKPVIISETGWPDQGTPDRNAVPSFENALRYFINTYTWADEEPVDVFYFSSFDETWKVDAEGDVGAYWGLWDKDGNMKYC